MVQYYGIKPAETFKAGNTSLDLVVLFYLYISNSIWKEFSVSRSLW